MANTLRSEWDASLRRAGVSGSDCATIANALIYQGFLFDSNTDQ